MFSKCSAVRLFLKFIPSALNWFSKQVQVFFHKEKILENKALLGRVRKNVDGSPEH
jgi:hypothetical protein